MPIIAEMCGNNEDTIIGCDFVQSGDSREMRLMVLWKLLIGKKIGSGYK